MYDRMNWGLFAACDSECGMYVCNIIDVSVGGGTGSVHRSC